MKPTVKVGIGGLAFNLEEDAFQVLDGYLQSLKKHFAVNPAADEIVADIEARLSELLQMRVNSNDGIVSVDDALEIIKIMGNPKDFDYTEESFEDNAAGNSGGKYKENKAEPEFTKKLYRDTDNKVLGGVCSGLGHYFRIDSVLVRLIFVGIMLFLFFFYAMHTSPSFMLVVLVYVLLWIVMPSAKTFKQRLEMTGSNPSIENIEDRSHPTTRKYKGRSVGRVLGILLNIFVGIVAFVTFFSLIGMIICFIWLYFDTEILGFNNYLILTGFDTWNFKIAVLIISLLPMAALFWLMIKILRRSSFTTHTLFVFIIGLIFWGGSVAYLTNKGVRYGHSHRDWVSVTETTVVDTKSDNLYINLGNDYLDAYEQPNNNAVLYKDDDRNKRQICILPNVKIREDSLLADYKFEIVKKGFDKNSRSAERKANALNLNYTVSDSLITINPQWYNNKKSWKGETFEIIVTAPVNRKVIIKDPLREYYHSNNNFTFTGYDYHYSYPRFDFD